MVINSLLDQKRIQVKPVCIFSRVIRIVKMHIRKKGVECHLDIRKLFFTEHFTLALYNDYSHIAIYRIVVLHIPWKLLVQIGYYFNQFWCLLKFNIYKNLFMCSTLCLSHFIYTGSPTFVCQFVSILDSSFPSSETVTSSEHSHILRVQDPF
jgi:hypothetical protein